MAYEPPSVYPHTEVNNDGTMRLHRPPPYISGLPPSEFPTIDHTSYFHQTTTSLLSSTITFTFACSFLCLVFFSWVRTRRTSIYGSRLFFVREEHRAEPLPEGFFSWMRGLFFLERDLVQLEKLKRTESERRKDTHFAPLADASTTPRDSRDKSRDSTHVKENPDTQLQLASQSGVGNDSLLSGQGRIGRLLNVLRNVPEEHDVEKGLSSINPVVDEKEGRTKNIYWSNPLHEDIYTVSGSDISINTSARQMLISKIGLDHYLLIRFLRMLFILSVLLAFIAIVVLIPLYTIRQTGESLVAFGSIPLSLRIESLHIGNVVDNERLVATVMVTAAAIAMVALWTWTELMMYLKLRKEFLMRSSARYSSKVVLLQNLPKDLRSASALKKLLAGAPGGGVEYVYLNHDTSTLEKAVRRRQVVLDKLEEAESNYMADIARASALVSATSLSMRSRSWLGKCVDNVKACLGRSFGSRIMGNQDEDDHVGPLKMYQLDDVPKLSLTDLLNPVSTPNNFGRTTESQRQRHSYSNGSSASKLTALKWFQKPKRPVHYNGIPFISKKQDSIRYYRGELCRLNKVIIQQYEQEATTMAVEQELKRAVHGHGKSADTMPKITEEEKADSVWQNNETIQIESKETKEITAPKEIKAPSSAFVLMRTQAGSKAVASGNIGIDRIPLSSRTLGLPPRDIEWRALGQPQTMWSSSISRTIISLVTIILLVGSGLVVAAISSIAVSNGWERVSAAAADIPAPPTVYLKQGIATPTMLAILMVSATWILNELFQYWGYVSKSKTELLTQRCCLIFLSVTMGIVHPFVTLSFSWQESVAKDSNANSMSSFLIHAIPSYCSIAFAYILVTGLALPLYQLLQISRLWATLPSITLWSTLEPLSWRKLTDTQYNSRKNSSSISGSPQSSVITDGTISDINDSSESITSDDSRFDTNFTPAPKLTPRQAFQVRQPPFFNLQTLYPYLVLLFTVSITTLPLAPALFVLWLVVLAVLNLSYRYLVLQVVTTKSQSGGLHFRQALNSILCPAVAWPPFILSIYLCARGAWVQAGFSIVITLAMLLVRIVISSQFKNREEKMLKVVEAFHQQPKMLMLESSLDFDLKTSVNRRSQTIQQALASLSNAQTAVSTQNSDVEYLQSSLGIAGNDLDQESDGPLKVPSDDLDTNRLSFRRRQSKKFQRPKTIIGQVRHPASSSPGDSRPRSMPVFDIDRYEKEILGLGFEPSKDDCYREDLEDVTQANNASGYPIRDSSDAITRDSFQTNTSKGNVGTGGREEYDVPISFDDVLSEPFDFNIAYTAQRAVVDDHIPSKAELEEEMREAKYREIVKALRRASSVATGKYINHEKADTSGQQDITSPNNNRKRRVQISTPHKDAISPRITKVEFPDVPIPRHSRTVGNVSQAAKSQFRKSMPPFLSPRKPSPHLFHQPSIIDTLSNVSVTSGLSLNGHACGVPSLPMLSIHRESAVAAKEKLRVQNLYRNPVLQEARARLVVWLPSQTERSFWGSYSGNYTSFGDCKYHSAHQKESATAVDNDDAAAVVEGLSISDDSSFDQSAPTLASNRKSSPSNTHIRHHCTCQLFQQVTKAVTEAISLADQEIRDLRTVGLTVWLDSRHVIWGQENEEDGRLGDRVMISTREIESVGGSSFQKQVGDGLLSWLESEEEVEDEEGESSFRVQAHGAVGVIGGSMGVIIKRPIGYYGRLVGDGEEDDISRRL
ncbi:hypothetical protein BGZ76_002509 [Entomortierella beljakovae]|nr:hypothetical protein BGZ76_002509 [Entomortierella beljakovae]